MKKLIMGIIFLSFTVSLFSMEFDDLRSLKDSEFPVTHNIEWKSGDEPGLELLPELPGTEQIRQRFSHIRPEITVEKLYRISLGRDNSANISSVFLRLANVFGNPETLTTYLYESGRLKKEIPLIEEAYICNARGRKASPLRFGPSDIPGTFDYFQYLDENNFSGMVMKLSLDITEQYVYLTSENAESLRYGIFPLMPKESIFMDNFLFVDGSSLYMYSISYLEHDVSIKKIGPYTINLAGMFGKRMDVMAEWITGEFLRH